MIPSVHLGSILRDNFVLPRITMATPIGTSPMPNASAMGRRFLSGSATQEALNGPGTPYLVAMKIDRPSFPIFSLELKQLRSCMETFMIRRPEISSVAFFTDVVLDYATDVFIGDNITFTPNLIPTTPLPVGFEQNLISETPVKENILTSYALKH